MRKSTSAFLVFILSFTIPALSADYLTFSWKMSSRFDECIRMYDTRMHEYDKKIMDFSKGWIVEFRSSGKFDKMPQHEYLWEIDGIGDLSGYHKKYTTTLPNLITSLPEGTIVEPKQRVISGNFKASNDSFIKKNNGTDTPPSREPIPPSWLRVERLPRIGFYKVKLTVRSMVKNNIEPLVTTQTIELRNIVIACLGDSFASGEGNPDIEGVPNDSQYEDCGDYTTLKVKYFLDDRERYLDNMLVVPKWFEIDAHRSMKSGYALAAREIENRDPHSVVTFINLAVSGAQIEDGLLLPQSDMTWMKKGQLGYLKDLVGSQKIDLLLLSIGGNDLGFSNILEEAAAETFLPGNYSNYQHRINNLKEAFTALGLYLKDTNQIRITNILLSEYPTHLFHNNVKIDGDYEYSCGIFQFGDTYLTITKKEISFLDRLGMDLQKAMSEAAAGLGWIQAKGIADKFMNHGYCSSDNQTYWISATYSCRYQADWRGLLHPNKSGHTIIRDVVLEKITPLLLPKAQKAETQQK